jgi:FAD/FMN-containing dehydrogenase
VGAGTRLGNLYDSLEEHGLTLPAGCGPSVGIAGLTLGGGIGQLGRRHGLTSDRLIGAQVVLADGSVVECDDHRDADLFWALRGAGGGNFGIVTSFDFNTLRSPAVTCFHLRWPFTNAAAVIRAWQAWAPPAAEELSPTLLVTAPSDVDRPPQLDVFGTMLGNSADTGEVLDGLVVRTGADPSSDVRSEMSYRECKLYLAELGSKLSEEQGRLEQGHLFSKSEFLRQPLSTESIDALVGLFAAGRRRGHKRELAFLPWGGMYNRVRSDATAFVHRDELFLLKHAVVLDPMSSPPERDAARGWLSSSWGLVHPRGSGGVYPNFPDPDLEDWERAYYGSNLKRLVSVKRKYDPDNLFRFQQSIPGS